MPRILSKGSKLEFADQNRDWDEESNIKDFDIVFFNLKSLAKRRDQFLQFESPVNKIQFPSKEDVLKLIKSGGDLICILPDTTDIKIFDITQSKTRPRKISQDLFEWLPADLNFKNESGESLGEKVKKFWRWYFNEEFKWPMCFTPTKEKKTPYLDLTETACSYSGTYTYVETLALNGYGEVIAANILFSKGYYKKINSKSDLFEGSIYLLPLKEGLDFGEFARKILEKNYSDFEESADKVPDWIEKYTLKEEKEILEEIKELENKLEGMDKYKNLLYEKGDALEKAVLKTLRGLGLNIEGEVPGKRDGMINFEDLKVVLEITGTSSNISMDKTRELNHWVGNIRAENPEENTTGLLVANIQHDVDPEERDFEIPSNIKDYLEQYEYKLLTTIELFKIMKKREVEDDIDKETIEEKIKNGDTIITFGDVALKDSDG